MAISSTYTGSKEAVVVIDSGWSSAWSTGTLLYQHDFADNDDSALNPDANAHGALVTSRILQDAPDVGIIALKVMSDGTNSTAVSTIEQALQWVVANTAAYNIVGVNLSLAGGNATTEVTTDISDELAALTAKRILTAVAAGNAGQGDATQDVSVYAADHNAICVSATTGTGQFPTWAQRNPALTDICADGTDVRLTNLAGQTYATSGSSFAAPTVTAAIALAQQAATQLRGTGLTQDEFVALAKGSGAAVGGSGYAELDTAALLAKLAQTYAPPAATSSTIVVNAQGTVAGGANAHFIVLIDGVKAGEGTAGTTAKDFAFTGAAVPGAAHKVQVQYDNDAVINGQDRNLLVNKITINGHAVAPTDAIVSLDKGPLDGRDVIAGQSGLWWNSTLVVDADKTYFPAGTTPPTTGTSIIVVNAQGTVAGGANAHFTVLIDGVKAGEGTAGTTAKDFAFTGAAAPDAAHKVQVQYDNDAVINGQDRNLLVNKITINDHAVAPTDAIVSLDKGPLDGRDVIAGQSGLWWNSTLVVNADKTYFPSTAASAQANEASAHIMVQQNAVQALLSTPAGTGQHPDAPGLSEFMAHDLPLHSPPAAATFWDHAAGEALHGGY